MTRSRTVPPAAALLLAAAASSVFAGCGGGGGSPAQTFAVGVRVTGLGGSNLVLHLGPASPGQDLAVAASGDLEFPGRLADGSPYTVAVKTGPSAPTQTCLVSGGSGTIHGADARVTVACTTDTFTVGGTVTGLAAGSSVRLQDAGADDLVVSQDGPFTFTSRVPSGGAFDVRVGLQPQSPLQFCAVAGGDGTVGGADVTSVTVSCRSDVFALGGVVSGLAGPVTLRLEGQEDRVVAANGSFAFLTPLPAGHAYAVTVAAQPTHPWQTCLVTGGAGRMPAAPVGSVTVTCATQRFAVGAAVSGVLMRGLTARLTVAGAAGAPVALDADGTFTFFGDVTSGQAWLVQLETVPPTQACTVLGGSGVMEGAPVTVAVTCGCAAGLGNCDKDPANGCEHDVTADVANCGACGSACSLAHAQAACSGGACTVAGCASGFADCDASAANGCETATGANPLHCGSCSPCALPHAGAGCTGGACTVASCVAGFADCDGNPASGCETSTLSDAQNCGTCGVACAPLHAPAACTAGACGHGPCDAGWGDCDGNPANGCEQSTLTDAQNCGVCGYACENINGTEACSGGACHVVSCNLDFADCDGISANGCEAPITVDPANCGGCGQACVLPHVSIPNCVASACGVNTCVGAWRDCDQIGANGCETDSTTSAQNCGSCGHHCGAGQSCAAGGCVAPASCLAILDADRSLFGHDGVYTIDPDGSGAGAPVQVYCDLTTDGGGWTFFAHVDQTAPAGNFFAEDLLTYSIGPSGPVDGGRPYGLGVSVYQPLLVAQQGAVEMMVTIGQPDPGWAILHSSLVFFRSHPLLPSGAPGFEAGPVPCAGLADGGFDYRLDLGSYGAGLLGLCEADWWLPLGAGGSSLIGFQASTFGTYWGSGMGGDDGWHDSYWYVR